MPMVRPRPSPRWLLWPCLRIALVKGQRPPAGYLGLIDPAAALGATSEPEKRPHQKGNAGVGRAFRRASATPAGWW